MNGGAVMESSSARTHQYGFRWRQLDITRICEDKERLVFSVKTPREELQVHVTPTGFVRIWDRDGKKVL